MIATYDPGARAAGLALWDGTELAVAMLARGKDWSETAAIAYAMLAEHVPPQVITDVVIERPQVYIQSRQKGDPNDLITVALNAGAFASRFYTTARITEYLPREWKGTVKKEIAIERFKKRLSAEELTRVDAKPKSLAHNVWDAVGLGLHHVGRR